MTSIRQEMAEWAGTEAAKATSGYKKKLEETEDMLAEALLNVEEAEERKTQLADRLRAAETDVESYREWCEKAMEDLRLEKHANKEATKVAMQAAHCQDAERLMLQKQVTEIRLEAKEAQELMQSCRLEIDHMQHQIERRERQLTTVENTVGRAQRSPDFEAPNDGGKSRDPGFIPTHTRQRNRTSPSETNPGGSLRHQSSPAGTCHRAPSSHHLRRQCTEPHREGQH